MTKTELTAQTTWDDNELGNLSLFVPLFGETIEFVLFPEPGKTPEVTDKMTAIVNDVLLLPPGQLDRVKELLWEECRFSFHVADYGVEPLEGESHEEAHFREFGIYNPEDAFAKSHIAAIHVTDELEGRYAAIKVKTGSQNYISLIVKNGSIIDLDDDGTYLGWFDKDEQHAHKKRQRLMAE